MIGLDTNVLLRYVVQDDPVQSLRATEIITRRLTEEEPGFVSLVMILQVVWVLKSLYKRSRQEIANDIEMVFAADTLEVQNEQEVYHAVVALRNGTGTFEDALAHWESGGGVPRPLPSMKRPHRNCTVSHWPDHDLPERQNARPQIDIAYICLA
jgi:predicted nucleic-acid-binding protein